MFKNRISQYIEVIGKGFLITALSLIILLDVATWVVLPAIFGEVNRIWEVVVVFINIVFLLVPCIAIAEVEKKRSLLKLRGQDALEGLLSAGARDFVKGLADGKNPDTQATDFCRRIHVLAGYIGEPILACKKATVSIFEARCGCYTIRYQAEQIVIEVRDGKGTHVKYSYNLLEPEQKAIRTGTWAKEGELR